ncbi:MAG: hypothetical protein ABIJ20_00875 [Nanoarchaeota archaeon]|nr:hypothetical protein [Nanoarchaeota archaeon]MBU1445203.1 hypothetical protein [Nanoarchaeota archaeon]MBU2406757.1 hypothetical protein [Nanoarchaeota archaeon]MBU2420287.1 hypothetical protein [Nanoarchaeota archaeon]MBU2475317.1 hypothetical protein [Nanoarchaeota archaeon]
MSRIINNQKNQSLGNLEVTRGDLVAFDNRDSDFSQLFIIARAIALIPGHHDGENALKLGYWAHSAGGDREEWTLYSKGKILGLWTPRGSYERLEPHYEIIDPTDLKQVYDVERAFSGTSFLDGLKEFSGFYGSCMVEGLKAARELEERNLRDAGFGLVGLSLLES